MARLNDLAREHYTQLSERLKMPPSWAQDDLANSIRAVISQSTDLAQRIGEAQSYQLSDPAMRLLGALLTDVSQGDGIFEMFGRAKLPFEKIWIEYAVPGRPEKHGALIEQTETLTSSMFVHFDGEGVTPALSRIEFDGADLQAHQTPHFRSGQLARTNSDARVSAWAEIQEEHEVMSIRFFGYAIAMATLLQHQGMLEAREVKPLPGRARKLKRKGSEPFPATRIQKVVLGEYGRGQLLAMQGEQEASSGARRRAHWVRGHFMRNRAGGVSWRMPHIRGAGPLIRQERHVEIPEEEAGPSM